MRELSIELQGPVSRALWERVRRRFLRPTQAGAVATGVGAGMLYAAAAVEPNLSGLWLRNGEPIRVIQVGRKVTGHFHNSEVLTFEAYMASPSEFAGFINLWWVEDDMKEACGDDARPDRGYRASISTDGNRIVERWTRQTGDQATCAITGSQPATSVMTRLTEPQRSQAR